MFFSLLYLLASLIGARLLNMFLCGIQQICSWEIMSGNIFRVCWLIVLIIILSECFVVFFFRLVSNAPAWLIFSWNVITVAGLVRFTFNLFLLVVVTFVSETFWRRLVKYYVFTSFFAYGHIIGLEILGYRWIIVAVYFRFGLELYCVL